MNLQEYDVDMLTSKRSSSGFAFPYAIDNPMVPYPRAVTEASPSLRVGRLMLMLLLLVEKSKMKVEKQQSAS